MKVGHLVHFDQKTLRMI